MTCGCHLVIAIHSRNRLAVGPVVRPQSQNFSKMHQSAGIRKRKFLSFEPFPLSQEDKN